MKIVFGADPKRNFIESLRFDHFRVWLVMVWSGHVLSTLKKKIIKIKNINLYILITW